MANTNPPKRAGILKGLGNMFLKDEFRHDDAGDEQKTAPSSASISPASAATVSPPSLTIPPTVVTTVSVEVDDLVKKIMEILQKINMEGIDFMEVWDGAEANGGVTLSNLQFSFNTLNKVAAKGTLTIEKVLQSGEYYKSELNRLMSVDIEKQKRQRQGIVDAQAKEQQMLQNDITQLTEQITQLQSKLLNQQNNLKSIDAKYQPQITDIDQKIANGNVALQKVIATVDDVLVKMPQIKQLS